MSRSTPDYIRRRAILAMRKPATRAILTQLIPVTEFVHLSVCWRSHANNGFSDPFKLHPLARVHGVSLYAILLVAIINILGRLPQAWTRVLLKGLKGLFRAFMKMYRSDDIDSYAAAIIKDIPNDIRQIQDRLKLETPRSTTYACCPNNACCKIYPPRSDGSWPDVCTNLLDRRGACGKPLLRTGPAGKDANWVRRPIRPYVVYDVKSLVAELLSYNW